MKTACSHRWTFESYDERRDGILVTFEENFRSFCFFFFKKKKRVYVEANESKKSERVSESE